MSEGRQIVLYGAGTIGQRFFRLLKPICPNVIMVDRNHDRIPGSFAPETLARLDPSRTVVFATAAGPAQESIREDAKRILPGVTVIDGREAYMTMQGEACAAADGHDLAYCWECGVVNNACTTLREIMRRARDHRSDATKSTRSTMIGYVLSGSCPLRCRYCCESVPRLSPAQKRCVPVDEILRDIEAVAAASDFLTLVEFVGGEPFLHHGLPSVIAGVLKIPNVGAVTSFTSGVVLPSRGLVDALRHDRVSVYVSDYTTQLDARQMTVREETISRLRDGGVSLFVGRRSNWVDLTSFRARDESEDVTAKRHADCLIHTCNRLHRGVLYRCAHHYGAAMLGVEIGSGALRVHDHSATDLPGALDEFFSVRSPAICRQCDMGTSDAVPQGEQT